MGWSPRRGDSFTVAGGSGNSDSPREELAHAKVGGQPSHIFWGDTAVCAILQDRSFPESQMKLQIAVEQETDGRWIAEVESLPGVLTYGVSRIDAVAKVQALALRALAERMELGEAVPELLHVEFQAA